MLLDKDTNYVLEPFRDSLHHKQRKKSSKADMPPFAKRDHTGLPS